MTTMLLRFSSNTWLVALALVAGGCRGAILDLGDPPPAKCADASCTDGRSAPGSGNYALFRIDSDDYSRPGESPRRSYSFFGDVTLRATPAPLRYGCLGAFEVDTSGECVLCTEDEVPRGEGSGSPTGSDVLLHSVSATGGELPADVTFRWAGTLGKPTTNASSASARAWGDGEDVRLAATFFRDPPITSSAGGDPILEARATIVPPPYLVLTPSSTPPRSTVRRVEDLVLAWAPREGATRPGDRVRVTLETKSEERFDAEHRSTGRVRRVSCEFESSSGSGVVRSEVLAQMAAGEKSASMTSERTAEVVGPLHELVEIPWLVRYELRSAVRSPEGDAFDAITLE